MNPTPQSFEEHCRNVYGCNLCLEEGERDGFVRQNVNLDAGPFFRFPPVIGKTQNVDLLFVGINPRISATNRNLHERLMSDFETFRSFGHNRRSDYSRYITRGARETHYRSHLTVVHAIYGYSCHFDEVAAVTELVLCASKSKPGASNVCADAFLNKTISITAPKIIIQVGVTVKKHFNKYYRQNKHPSSSLQSIDFPHGETYIVTIPHPAARVHSRQVSLTGAINEIKSILQNRIELQQSNSTVIPELVETELFSRDSRHELLKRILKTRSVECKTQPQHVWIESENFNVHFWKATRLTLKKRALDLIENDNALILIQIAPESGLDVYQEGYVLLSKKELISEPSFLNAMNTNSYLKPPCYYNWSKPPRVMERYFISASYLEDQK